MTDLELSVHVASSDDRVDLLRQVAAAEDAQVTSAVRHAVNAYALDAGLTVAVTVATNVLTISVTPD